MKRWPRNRVVPAVLTFMNGAFWLSLRGGEAAAEKYPFLTVVERAPVRLAALFALGVTLCWALAALGARGRKLWAAGLGGAAGFALLQGACQAWTRGGGFRAAEIGGGALSALAGAALFALMVPRARDSRPAPGGGEVSLKSLSDNRSLLMGAAMLYVMLFHTESSGAVYPPVIWEFFRFGFTGVDLFLLLSGIGMVFSLERDSRALPFYARRARKIYPQTVAWVFAFSAVSMCAGRCGLPLLVANCLGVGYWVSGGSGAFNWYISALLMFYLLAPFAFRLLRRRRGRGARAAAMLTLALFPMFAAVDFLHRRRLLMALSRLPVFLLGMLAGFWVREDARLTRGEYRSLLPLAAVLALSSLASIAEDFPALGWLWLSGGAAMALASLPLANALGRLHAGGAPARLLRWMGENSLPLYLSNVLLLLIHGLLFDGSAGSGARSTLCALALVGLNLGLVWVVQKLCGKARALIRAR